jgi:kynurenine formamidase
MPLYPGSRPPRVAAVATLEREGYRESRISLSSHTGTHLDLPFHLLPGGAALEAIPAERFCGPAAVIPLPGAEGTVIRVEDLLPHAPGLAGMRFLLLATGWDRRWEEGDPFRGHPVLDPEAARWLAGFAPWGVGTDAPSLDAPDAPGYPAHRIFLERGIFLLENLRGLLPLAGTPFHLICLPLPVRGADGLPVRAAALVHD